MTFVRLKIAFPFHLSRNCLCLNLKPCSVHPIDKALAKTSSREDSTSPKVNVVLQDRGGGLCQKDTTHYYRISKRVFQKDSIKT